MKKNSENQKFNLKGYLEKGSYTVEAVVIMGVAFLVIAAILYMGSFLYGRASLTASAYEMAFTGRTQKEYGLFGFDSVEREVSFSEEVNCVSYSGRCYAAWGGFEKNLQIKAAVEKTFPVTLIRKWQIVNEIRR